MGSVISATGKAFHRSALTARPSMQVDPGGSDGGAAAQASSAARVNACRVSRCPVAFVASKARLATLSWALAARRAVNCLRAERCKFQACHKPVGRARLQRTRFATLSDCRGDPHGDARGRGAIQFPKLATGSHVEALFASAIDISPRSAPAARTPKPSKVVPNVLLQQTRKIAHVRGIGAI